MLRLVTKILTAYLGISAPCHSQTFELNQMPLIQLEAKAVAGDPGAQVQMALRHNSGRGVTYRVDKTQEWMEKAAKSGHRTAIGICAMNGWGCNRALVLARECFQEQSQKGDITATRNLGRLYEEGLGVEQDYKKAFDLYLKAAESKDPLALRFLGGVYEKGKGTPPDLKKAHSCFLQADQLGDSIATYELARLTLTGAGCVKDESFALTLFNRSVDRGFPPAAIYLGQLYHDGEIVGADPEKAFGYWQRAASFGLPAGIHLVGTCYEKGIHVRSDKVTPLFLYRASAVLGYPESHIRLAELMEGQPKIAREHWLKAGELGRSEGYHFAGLSFQKEKNFKQANGLYEKAIQSGYLGSEYSLGLNQFKGLGMTKNLKEGAARIQRSWKNGFVEGILEKEHLARVNADIDFFRLVNVFPGLVAGITVGPEAKALSEASANELMRQAAIARLEGFWPRAVCLYLMAGDKGNGDGWDRLGVMCSEGKELPKDERLAMSFFFKGAALGSGPCNNRLAYHYRNGLGCEKDDVSARYYFEIAAKAGDARGASNAGMLWSGGIGGPQDHKKAFSYFQQAHELNNARGTFYLGQCYELGNGVAKDQGKAFEYFLKAAVMGDDQGCFYVAHAYHTGKGVKRDIPKAVPFYRRAVAQDYSAACHNLAIILADKKSGVKTDIRLARALYEKAAHLGNKSSQDFLRDLGPSKVTKIPDSVPTGNDKHVTELLTSARQDLDKEKLLECIDKCQEAIALLDKNDPEDWLPWTLAHSCLAAAFNGVLLSNGKVKLPDSYGKNPIALAIEASSDGLMLGQPAERKLMERLPDRFSRLHDEMRITYALLASRLSANKELSGMALSQLIGSMKHEGFTKITRSFPFLASSNRTLAWLFLQNELYPASHSSDILIDGIESAEDAIFYASLDTVVTPSQRILIARSKVLLACGLTRQLEKSVLGDPVALESTRIEELLKQAGDTFRELCPGTTDAASVISHQDELKAAVLGRDKNRLMGPRRGDTPPTSEQDKKLKSHDLDDASSPQQHAPGTKPGTEQPEPRETK